MSEIVVNDPIQSRFDTSEKPFLKELILFITLYLFYNNTESPVFIVFVKYSLILLCVRFGLNVLTERRDTKTDKRYFILNPHIILFSLICLLYNAYIYNSGKTYLTWIIIISYSLLVISTKEHLTSDSLLTLLTVYTVITNQTLKGYIEG
jgi:hypothetical protein